MYQSLNGEIPSRKCSIKASAKGRNSVALMEICHQRSIWLGPMHCVRHFLIFLWWEAKISFFGYYIFLKFNLFFQIRESFGFQLFDTGYIQITEQPYQIAGLYLYILSIICFIIILVGQVRIEFDYHREFKVTPLRVAFLSAVIFNGE